MLHTARGDQGFGRNSAQLSESSHEVVPSWSKAGMTSAAVTAAFGLLVKLGFTEFVVTADAMPADGARLCEQFRKLWDVPHNRDLLVKRLREFLPGQFPLQSF